VTIVIGMVNEDQAILISDRRLSDEKDVRDLEATKGTLLDCRDARICLGFTGIATEREFITERWLLETLTHVAAPDCRWGWMAGRFCTQATRDFTEQFGSPVAASLSILCVGYQYNACRNRAYPDISLISNCECLPGVDILTSSPVPPPWWGFVGSRIPGTGVTVLGSGRYSLPDGAITTIGWMNHDRHPAHRLIETTLDFVRQAARSDHTVGANCNSIIVPRQPHEPAELRDHPIDSEEPVAYVPFIVNAECVDRPPYALMGVGLGVTPEGDGPPEGWYPWWAKHLPAARLWSGPPTGMSTETPKRPTRAETELNRATESETPPRTRHDDP
jgi:hypothetical protein